MFAYSGIVNLTRKRKLRPILEAASVWSLDNVKWMLEDDEEKVDKPTAEIVDLYVASDPFLKFVKKIISVVKGAKIEVNTIMDPAHCMKGMVEAHFLAKTSVTFRQGFRLRSWDLRVLHRPCFKILT